MIKSQICLPPFPSLLAGADQACTLWLRCTEHTHLGCEERQDCSRRVGWCLRKARQELMAELHPHLWRHPRALLRGGGEVPTNHRVSEAIVGAGDGTSRDIPTLWDSGLTPASWMQNVFPGGSDPTRQLTAKPAALSPSMPVSPERGVRACVRKRVCVRAHACSRPLNHLPNLTDIF